MKRTNLYAYRALKTADSMSPAADLEAVGESTVSDRARSAREAVRGRQPPRAFGAKAIRELSQAARTDQTLLRRTIRRSELRQIVPLADSTIYELERRGEFPQRYFLTARCVVWDLAEVEAWLRSRRQLEGPDAVKKAPAPDSRKRQPRTGTENRQLRLLPKAIDWLCSVSFKSPSSCRGRAPISD